MASTMQFDVFEWAEGGNNEFVHHLPGRLRYPYLSLDSGLTDNDDAAEVVPGDRPRSPSSRRSRSS